MQIGDYVTILTGTVLPESLGGSVALITELGPVLGIYDIRADLVGGSLPLYLWTTECRLATPVEILAAKLK